MNTAVTIAASLSLFVAALAALCDWQRGEIPNWLTLPVILLAPWAYGFAFGVEQAMHSLVAAFLSGLPPYLLFRRGVMGGGDVKLFAALGALMGFDLLLGVETQLTAFAIAMLAACAGLVWRGALLVTLSNAFAVGLAPLLPLSWRREPCPELLAPVRMGASIFVAAALLLLPHLMLAWSSL